jgi:excinuclease ABC subunit A
MGPDGGTDGGEVVAMGTPEEVAKGNGATAQALLNSRAPSRASLVPSLKPR